MLGKFLALLVGEAFRKKPWRLWGWKRGMKAWRDFGTGSMRRLLLYDHVLFGEGWRTQILAKGIIAPAVPPDNS